MKTTRRVKIILIIDPDTYKSESGDELTHETALELGHQVNKDSASILGYEGWQVKDETELVDDKWNEAN